MVQSPSSETNWFATSQEIPRISRNPKVHYRTRKRPPPVPILDQPNPVHIPTSHLLEIHLNIIHPPTPWSPQWSPSLWFPHQDPVHPLSSPICATCPAHLILLDFITCLLNNQYITILQLQSDYQLERRHHEVLKSYTFYPAKNTYQILCILTTVKHIGIPIYTQHQ